MSVKMRGVATERIPFGALVLCRAFRVSLAGPDIANGSARSRPSFCRQDYYDAGECVFVDPIDGLGARDLHAMVNAPLMDANTLYLPAGKLSLAEYRARVASDMTEVK